MENRNNVKSLCQFIAISERNNSHDKMSYFFQDTVPLLLLFFAMLSSYQGWASVIFKRTERSLRFFRSL